MPSIEPILDFVFSDHALIEMTRREISQEQVRNVLPNPEQTERVREGRAVYQAKCDMGEPPYVVTVYRMSKIEKYWR